MSKNKLKIGVVVDQLLAGGVQLVAIEQVRQLRNLGHEAKLIILMRKKYPTDFSYLVKNIPHRYLSDSYPWPFRSTIKFPIFSFLSTLHLLSPFLAPRTLREDFDILISHGTTTCLTTLGLWRKRKIPYIAVIHDPIIFILKKVYSKTILRLFFPFFVPLSYYVEKMFVGEALATIIVSNVHREFIKKTYQAEPIILPHGSDVPDKIPSKRGPSILAISRWQKEKNPQFLLRLLKQLPHVQMIIAGIWTSNTDFKKFEKDAEKLGIRGRIKILPEFETADLPKLFRQARVFVHPHLEAFGMGALEAASFGVPVIIPAGSGITNLLEDGVNGFFPKRVTIDEYKKYIQKLLADEKLAYKMGRHAWLKVKKEFSWRAHTEKLLFLATAKLEKILRPKITAIEIGHAGGTGLSGGDKIFEEMVKRMPEEFNVEIVTSPFGSHHWKETNLEINLKILPPNPFEEKSDPISVFLSYLIRMIQTCFYLFKKSKNLEILYSSTNILPDVMPAFTLKFVNPKIVWVARIHHLVPHPLKREGKLLVNIVSYLMQGLSIFCMRSFANLTIALNKALFGELFKTGFPKNKLSALGAGIDFEQIARYQPKKIESLDGVYLGRLHVAKGIFDTVDIWSKVVRERPDARLVLIGAGPENIRSELKKKIKRKNLQKNIKVLGYLSQNEVYDHLKSAKVFLFTDHEAGWGLAIAEAMACRLPVVGYDIGILGDIYKRGFRVVELGDTLSFAKEILDLLENPRQKNKLAQLASWEARGFDWRKTTEKFTKIIEPFIKQK